MSPEPPTCVDHHAQARRYSRHTGWLGAALLVLAAGCGGVPQRGSVSQVGTIRPPGAGQPDPDPGPPLRREPVGPRPGAGPEEIVRGFLDAQPFADDEHAVARRFLTAGATWDDRATTVISTGSRDVRGRTAGATATVVVRTRRTALVSPDGSHQPVSSDVAETFRLSRTRGEWRLASVPAGVRLAQNDVGRAMARVVLFFPDADRRRLVPDPVLLPLSGAVSPAAVLDRLLAGPTQWLAPAVRTAAPVGTRVVGIPALTDGILAVNFSREVRPPSTELRALVAQLVYTLTEPGLGVSGVRLLVEGQPLLGADADAERPRTRADVAEFAPAASGGAARAYVIRTAALHELVGDALVQTGFAPSGLRSASVSADGADIAGVRRTGDRERLVLSRRDGDGPDREAVSATRLTAPSWEPGGGSVWTVANGTTVVAVRVRDAATENVRSELPGPVSALALSPEGRRIAVVAGGAVYVGRLAPRPAGGREIGAWRAVAPGLGEVSALSWDGPLRVVASGRRDNAVAILRIDVDGFDIDEVPADGLPVGARGELPALAAITAAPEAPLLVELGGRIFRGSRAGPWRLLVTGTGPTYAPS